MASLTKYRRKGAKVLVGGGRVWVTRPHPVIRGVRVCVENAERTYRLDLNRAEAEEVRDAIAALLADRE
jgi:hypothetical protein